MNGGRRFEFGRPALVALALLLLWSAVATANVRHDPVKIRLVGTPAPVKTWDLYEGVFEIEVAEDIRIDGIAFSGEGWHQGRIDAPASLQLMSGGKLSIPFSAVPVEAEGRVGIRYQTDGRTHEAVLDPAAWYDEYERGSLSRLEPGEGNTSMPANPRWPDKRLPGPGDPDRPDTFRDDDDATGPSSSKSRDIRVLARIYYIRDDGVVDFPRGMPFKIFDEDYGPDDQLYSGTVDENGYIDATCTWDPCAVCDQNPDLYIECYAADSQLQIQTAILEWNYGWHTHVKDDYTGTFYDFGPQCISKDRPAAHMYKILRRAINVYEHEGYDMDAVDVQWPDDDTQFNPIFEEIHISANRQWDEGSYLHELGHHWQHQYTYAPYPIYCNGICDEVNPYWIDDCGHCMWCQEEPETAHLEGIANFLAYVIGDYFRTEMDPPPQHWRQAESCLDDTSCDGIPHRTEGNIMAFLQDLDDYFVDNDSLYTVDQYDDVNVDVWTLVEILDVEAPHDMLDWWDILVDWFPDRVQRMWAAGVNNGLNFDYEPPTAPTGLYSPTHTVGVPSPDATIYFMWDESTDDASGVAGYDYTISQDYPLAPGTTVRTEYERLNSDTLTPGTWYFTVRAIDNNDLASLDYATAGPYIIQEPDPADLTFDPPSHWIQELVPHREPVAGPGVPAQPDSLIGWTDLTWWSVVFKNQGDEDITQTYQNNLYVDGVFMDGFERSSASPGADIGYNNAGTTVVPGGLHTFEFILDAGEVLAETSETNNGTAYQYVWSPETLVVGTDVRRGAPPDLYGGIENLDVYEGVNCDGYRFASVAWWSAVVMDLDDDDVDYNMMLHQPSTGPENGFTGLGETSAGRPKGCTDALIVNRNMAGWQDWDVGVINADIDGDSFYNLRLVTSEEIALGANDFFGWAADDFLALYEFGAVLPEQMFVSAVLTTDELDSPIHLALLNEDFTVGDLVDASLTASTDETGVARLDMILSSSGFHGLAVYRDRKDGTDAVYLELELMMTPPDLLPTVATGWFAPLVPRPDDWYDPLVMTEPDTLYGDTWGLQLEGTWFNVAGQNLGPMTATEIPARIYLDGEDHADFCHPMLAPWATETYQVPGRYDVPAGRHTVAFHIDDPHDILEIDEANNTCAEQWVWGPHPIRWYEAPSVRGAPPEMRGGFDALPDSADHYFNCDGVRLPAASEYDTTRWYGVAAMPGDSSDVNLRLHEVGRGARDGFRENLINSSYGRGQLDYILINHDLTPKRPFDVGILNNEGTEDYTICAARAEIWDVPVGVHGPIMISGTEYFHMYEFELPSGNYDFTLNNMDGLIQWGMGLHDGNEDPVQNRFGTVSEGAAWYNGPGLDEAMNLTLAAGRHCLTVWKADADCAMEAGSYMVTIAEGGSTGVDEIPPLARDGIATIFPNPFNPSTCIAYELKTAGEARLAIFDAKGRRIRDLVSGHVPAGRHEIVWQGRDTTGREIPSGVYFVRFASGDVSETRKIMLLQ